MNKSVDLSKAYEGSYYSVLGCGGELSEWVKAYEMILKDADIGKPVQWFCTTGKDVNEYASSKQQGVLQDPFPEDLIIILFPLDELNTGKLALFKLRMQDRWFDDVIDNMRTVTT